MPSFLSLPRGRYTRRMLALLSVVAITAGFVVAAKAQPAPPPQLDAPLHIVVGYAPGGATDLTGALAAIAEGFTRR